MTDMHGAYLSEIKLSMTFANMYPVTFACSTNINLRSNFHRKLISMPGYGFIIFIYSATSHYVELL